MQENYVSLRRLLMARAVMRCCPRCHASRMTVLEAVFVNHEQQQTGDTKFSEATSSATINTFLHLVSMTSFAAHPPPLHMKKERKEQKKKKKT